MEHTKVSTNSGMGRNMQDVNTKGYFSMLKIVKLWYLRKMHLEIIISS